MGEGLFQLLLIPGNAALHAQVVLPRLIGIIGTLFLREALQGAHGLSHLRRLHPVGKAVGVQAFAVFEELQPPLFFGFDRAGGEFVQLEQADAAMLQQGAAALVAQAVAVGIGGFVPLCRDLHKSQERPLALRGEPPAKESLADAGMAGLQ